MPSPIQTVLSALESHQIHRFQNLGGNHLQTAQIPDFQIGSRARGYPHYRRLGISPDPEGDHNQLGYDQQIFNYY